MVRAVSAFFAQVFSCWNWKCAALSATARSVVYLVAMARTGVRGGLAIVLVETVYVTMTSGLYAGLQQKALGIRSRLLGNATIVFAVPWLAQGFDWLAHHAAGAVAPARATVAVLVYATVSALFHLHVMRRGAFLTGKEGRTLRDDVKRIPRLLGGFVFAPVLLFSPKAERLARRFGVEAAF